VLEVERRDKTEHYLHAKDTKILLEGKGKKYNSIEKRLWPPRGGADKQGGMLKGMRSVSLTGGKGAFRFG